MLNNRGFDYSKLFEADEVVDKAALVEAEKRLDAIGEAARACINTDKFNHYKKQYERAYDSMVDVMIAYTNKFCQQDGGDVSKYALMMVRYVTRIQNLKMMLNQIELDARKGLHEEK